MKFCMPHWERLKAAIEARGLNHLIAKDGVEAANSVERQIKGEDDKSDFDPLASATWAIYSAYIRDIGLAAMIGDQCPLCGVKQQRDDLDENWTSGAAEDSLAQARALGLMPEPS